MSGGPTPTRSVSHRECITREEATELAWVEHAKLHVGREHIWDQLLDKIYSPLLDMSITSVICECGRCKNFGSLHTHTLLAPITRRWPFELLVGDYLSMPMGKGGFTKIGLFVDVFSQRLFGFKLKASAGKNTVDCLHRISQTFWPFDTFMANGGMHFNCNEVREECETMGTKLHIVATHAPWLNGLLEGSNHNILHGLAHRCAPGLGEDDYTKMSLKDLPKNWPDHLDEVLLLLNECILPGLQYFQMNYSSGTWSDFRQRQAQIVSPRPRK